MSIVTGHPPAGDAPACAGRDPELFYPPKDTDGQRPNREERRALAVCRSCPVRAACLEAALEFPANEQHGVIGGMTAGQRRATLAAQRRRPTRSYVDALAGLPIEARRNPAEVDGLVVMQLMAGQPVPAATRPEAAHAAVMLHRCGYGPQRIAAQLGTHPRQVDRWIRRYEAGEPLCPPAGPHRQHGSEQDGAAA